MGFDLNKLQAVAGQLKEESASSNSNNGEWPNVTFLPEGKHRGRFIIDPEEELYLKFTSYGYFAKGIRNPEDYPDQLPAGFHNRLSELGKELAEEYLKFGRKMKTNFLVYFYLLETDAPSEDWKPNNLYCILCDWRFETAFSGMINSLVKDAPDKLLASLRPEQPGPIMEINSVRGNKGSCSVSATFSEGKPLVILTDEEKKLSEEDQNKLVQERVGKLGYKPLQISYIKPGFDQVKYNALVVAYEAELTELRQKRNLQQAAGVGSADNPKPNEPADGQDGKTEGTQTTGNEQQQTTEAQQHVVTDEGANADAGTQQQTNEQTQQTSEPVTTEQKVEEKSAPAGEVKANPFDKFKRQS